MIQKTDRLICRSIETPDDQQCIDIIALYRSQGWWKAEDDNQRGLLHRLIAGSHVFIIAERAEGIVGIGRAISDGVSDAYIQDVTVNEAYRRQGIGRIILETLLKRLTDDSVSWIGLIAEPGSVGLYRSVGFRDMSGRVPMLMVRER